MVYSIVYDAIKTKITRFEIPSPLINVNEVAAALSMGYAQASVPKPEIHVGDTVDQLREPFLEMTNGVETVNPNLIKILKDYPYGEKTITEDALATYTWNPSQS